MSKKNAPAIEQRAPDQDGAVEVAFAEGALPEEDRREPSVSDREHGKPPEDRHQSPDVAAQTIKDTDVAGTEPASPSLLIDKDADGLWQVTSTYKDGRVTVTHWVDIRHALNNGEPWARAHM